MSALACLRSGLVGALLAVALDAQNATTPRDEGALQRYLDEHHMAGAVALLANKDEVLEVEAAGWASLETCEPMREDTLFFIASQAKPMTAVALLMLVDEGLLGVDDPVERFLPEFTGQWLAVERDEDRLLLRPPAHPIRIRELLAHTSGLPFRSAMEQPTLDGLSLRDAARSYAMSPLEFEPGKRYQYSNAGFNTVGRIVEVLSGMPYEEFMDVRLFEPLGMRDTTFLPSAEQVRRLATHYEKGSTEDELVATPFAQLSYPLSAPGRHPIPAAGLFSTARDVARFCQMILNRGALDGRRYLSEAAVEQMTKKQTGAHVKQRYGFGWYVNEASFGHPGLYRTHMLIEPTKDRIVVFMAHQHKFAGPEGDQLLEGFRSRDPVHRR